MFVVRRMGKFGLLLAFRDREGHCDVPDRHEEQGVKLGNWLSYQRAARKKGTCACAPVAGAMGEAVLLPSRLLQPAVLPDAEVLQSKRQALAPRRDTCRPSALLGHLRARWASSRARSAQVARALMTSPRMSGRG